MKLRHFLPAHVFSDGIFIEFSSTFFLSSLSINYFKTSKSMLQPKAINLYDYLNVDIKPYGENHKMLVLKLLKYNFLNIQFYEVIN